MKINLIEKDINSVDANLEISLVNTLDKLKHKDILDSLNFKIENETSVLLAENKIIYTAFEDSSYDSIALAIASAINKIKNTKYTSAKIKVCETLINNFKPLIEGALLAYYSFDRYKSKKSKNNFELIFVVDKKSKKLENILKESKIIAKAVNKARDMINTPPVDFYPETMANIAKDLAEDVNINCKVEGENYLKKHNMASMYSVGIASPHESKLIHLSYKPKNAKKKIVLVGKGLTYDSGGLSLKPSTAMLTMKADKSGACAVLTIIWAIAKLKLPIEVHTIIGAVENMIGANAFKPDDVLKAKNGKTIEVKNTDAEGRLVLCDCLCYAQDEIKDIDYIFNYATLTGACVVGLGEFTSAIMGNNNKLKNKMVETALNSGEYATALDFNRYLRKTMKSDIADISNISNTRYGGTLTGGIFLDNFIEEENKNKWLHFDIAGPAFIEKPWGYNPSGASGAAVRMTIEFIKNQIK